MKRKLEEQIDEYIAYCRDVRMMTHGSIKVKKAALLRFARMTQCNDIRKLNNEHINEWIKTEIRQGVAPQSINDYICKIVAMVRYYREMGMVIPLKIMLIPKLKENRKKRTYYSKEQIEEVLKTADDISALMIRIAFDTGMRLHELTTLKISDFNDRKVGFMGKGRIWHESYISEKTYTELKKYLSEYAVGPYLWQEPNSNVPLSDYTVSKKLAEPFLACGYEDFHPHALRHSFATDLQVQGASIEEIQHMIGHSSATTTENYLHGFDDDKMKSLFNKYKN